MTSKPNQEPLQAARGMNDVLPARAEGYARLESVARRLFNSFSFKEIRTPVLEPAALFERAVGAATDIVEKEMFTLKDRGDRLLCLRPEGTAGVVRAFIENDPGREFPISKFFYIGPMFRAERPQKGRYREFVQIGSECFGNPRPAADAETIGVAMAVIRGAGVDQAHVLVNSIGCSECRPAYLKKLVDYLKGISGLCEHCKTRMSKNPLRVLDCKGDASKLEDAPKTVDSLCAACREHYAGVRKLLKMYAIPYSEQSRLVRGLDYYTRTVFEIYPAGKSGSQDALAAGGRYDDLVGLLGGTPTPAVGFALGVERVLNEIEAQNPASEPGRKGVFVVTLGDAAFEPSQKLLWKLREAGVPSETGWPDQSIKSQMRLADRLNMEYCVIIGENEIKSGKYAVKNLSEQTQRDVQAESVVEAVQAKK